jgi:glucokinase
VAKYRIGVDLGGTSIKVGIFSGNGELLGKKNSATDPFCRSWREVVADMAGLIEGLFRENGAVEADCHSIGVGTPGLIDSRKGTVVYASNFNWERVPILEELKRRFDLPMALANDADCAVLGETVAGAAKGAKNKNVVMFTLGTGVGGGVVLDGRLSGGGPGKMELGHTIIVAGGEPCRCGILGCLEAYASATALIRDASRAAEDDRDSKMWELCGGELSNMNGRIPFDAMRAGDKTAKRVVENYIGYLGVGVANAINIWRPDIILLGGGIANEGDGLILPLTERVRANVFAGDRGCLPIIKRATMGNDAGLYGAAALNV